MRTNTAYLIKIYFSNRNQFGTRDQGSRTNSVPAIVLNMLYFLKTLRVINFY